MVTHQFSKRANSKAQITTYSPNRYSQTVYPDFRLNTAISMINSDPVARGALEHFVDKCMEGDFAILKRDNLAWDEVFQKDLQRKHLFRTEVIRKSFLMGKLFNNVFVEIVKNADSSIKSLNVLDSSIIQPVTKPNGDPIKYVSTIPNTSTGKHPEWSTDEIVWIKFGDRSVGYAPINMRALYETLLAKEYVTRYVSWLWKTGQYRLLYTFENGTADQDIEDFVSYTKRNDEDFTKPSLIKGVVETKIIRDIKETESIERLLKYYDSQILILMRVPPIDAGIPDASGRSNADAQSNNFNSHIASYKKVIEDYVSHQLFPKMNKGNNILKFGPNDRFTEEQIFKVVQMMKAVQMKDDVIREYLMDRGMFFKSEELFNDPMDMMVDSVVANPKEKDGAISRQRGTVGAEQNKVGTGKQSSTREDQL